MGAEQSLCCDKRSSGTKATDGNNRNITRTVISNTGSGAPEERNTRPGALDDAHSAATTPPNGSSPEKVGIGAYFQRSTSDANGLAVKSLLKGSPAQRSGRIAVGDVVLAVNGDRVYGKKLADLAGVLLGPSGSKVSMTFKSCTTQEEYTVELQRGIPGY
uniref:PDZ domain-containing protein n=1 Tax=Hemiselmis tepida TaxID=464990 RepID=A0A7S0YZ26_9CRYP|mmetsp:Transcript_33602/g.86121  ORF Transcript_33602/g.86121 Transcript_33602/m.86121 type:complete len:160 (+) Transcript_33602:30-509(+)